MKIAEYFGLRLFKIRSQEDHLEENKENFQKMATETLEVYFLQLS